MLICYEVIEETSEQYGKTKSAGLYECKEIAQTKAAQLARNTRHRCWVEKREVHATSHSLIKAIEALRTLEKQHPHLQHAEIGEKARQANETAALFDAVRQGLLK